MATGTVTAEPSAVPADAGPASRGFMAAIGAFAIWGLFPLYLIGLKNVSAMQITAHRIVWSCLFALGWLAAIGDLGKLREAFKRRDVLIRLVASAFFIAVNWLGFAWAVNHQRVLEVSLAYFIGPLLNVMLGIFVLAERLNRTQWVAVGFAAAGVAYLTFVAGQPPWIALMVGSSFALYGLIRKTVRIDALPGLAIETILLTPFAAGYLVWCEATGTGVLGHSTGVVAGLLLAGGVVTSVPLVMFAFGARLVPYSTIGVLQFIAPSMQLVCGLVAFGETIGAGRAAGFALIWAGLLVYIGNALWQARARRQATG